MDQNKAIEMTVLDYVEGWYTANAVRIENALSNHQAKRCIASDREIMAVAKAWMVDATEKGFERIEHLEQERKEIRTLGITETIATVELLSEEFVDYLHRVKVDGAWKIAKALWDYHGK